jgi:hypothetical protein
MLEHSFILNKVPARVCLTLSVTPGDIEVLGIIGDTLDAVVNVMPIPVHFQLSLSPEDIHTVTLQPNEHYDIGLDASVLIKQRLMPYVEAPKNRGMVRLGVIWRFSA